MSEEAEVRMIWVLATMVCVVALAHAVAWIVRVYAG